MDGQFYRHVIKHLLKTIRRQIGTNRKSGFSCMTMLYGGQNLERRNVERPTFRNAKIANFKITKDKRKLNDNFIFKFSFSFLN